MKNNNIALEASTNSSLKALALPGSPGLPYPAQMARGRLLCMRVVWGALRSQGFSRLLPPAQQ